MQTLQTAFATIPDGRGSHGKRYSLPILLFLVMLGIMSGYRGYRGLSRFMPRHRITLSARLNLRDGVKPCRITRPSVACSGKWILRKSRPC